ncbi:MAG: N-formylglutamate deformylase [Xanthomonadales bacterium]|nr:N-formylglutamate deformylase [Xanthomonadales bacterium]
MNAQVASSHVIYELHEPRTPVLVSVPHAGTRLSEGLAARLMRAGRALPDTDWFVDRLWSWVTESGAGLLVATHSRYVVDLNRPADDAPLYSGPTTGLVPVETFAGESLYAEGAEPDTDDVALRIEAYWRPYHDVLGGTLRAMHEHHGHAVLLDAHSIRSRVPRLFSGRLPDLNLGTWDGRSADPRLAERAEAVLADAEGFTHVRDGRFKGGYTTRHYGCPAKGYHALQLEMAQASYMSEEPPTWDGERAAGVRPVLESLLRGLLDWRPGK